MAQFQQHTDKAQMRVKRAHKRRNITRLNQRVDVEDSPVNVSIHDRALSTASHRNIHYLHGGIGSNAVNRWLFSQVGQPWSKVRAKLLAKFTTQARSWFQVTDYVELHTYIEQDKVMVSTGLPVTPGSYYVHPKGHLARAT